MSRHYGVTCDSCLAEDFRGKRYKCLRCYDYDLCAGCFEAGLSTGRHAPDHPVQCVLTRGDISVYFGATGDRDRPDSYTCPHCGRLGLALTALVDHVAEEHSERVANNSSTYGSRYHNEVLCPVCAANQVDGSNRLVTNLLGHLTVEHRYDCPPPPVVRAGSSSTSTVRRTVSPHSSHSRSLLPEQCSGFVRTRRSQLHFGYSGSSTISPLAILAASADNGADPIADFISHLSTVRRASGSLPSSTSSRPVSISSTRALKPPLTPRGSSSNVNIIAAEPSTCLSDVRSQRLLLSEKLAAPPSETDQRLANQIRRERSATACLVLLATILPDSTQLK